MKKLLLLTLTLSLFLTSCSLFRSQRIEAPVDDVQTTAADTTFTEETTEAETTQEETTKNEEPLPCLIGFYDDLQNNGTYTRLTEWHEPWIKGKDIAVFDVIPSTEESLYSASYKRLWKEESAKVKENELVKPSFVLEYTLLDGTTRSVEISSYEDSEMITDEGYLEVYLYDDIHQEDGVWYYHLTKDTTDESTVISSFKLTAGENIESVSSIILKAKIDGSSEAVIEISRPQ